MDRRGAVRADQDRQREEVIMPGRNNAELSGEDDRLPTRARVRAFLESVAKRQIPITYQELAKALQILPPRSIHRVTEALERLMEEDAAAGRPFIAALAISKARGGLPAPEFFDCARRLGRFAGDPHGQDAWSFHAAELNAVLARWAVRATTDNEDIMCTETNPTSAGRGSEL
jgi:hypothetical protein